MGVYYERARLLFRQGRHEQAARELREELAEMPHDGQTHAFLGRCLARLDRLADALAEGEEGVRLAPDLPYAHYMLSLTYTDAGRPKEAEAAVNESLRLDPRNPEQLAWLSWLQLQRGDRPAALATADQGLAIDPQHVGCLNRRGYILRWTGDWKGAEVAVRAALAQAPEDGYTHANLGWTLWSKGHALAGSPGYFQPFRVARRREMGEAFDHFREALRFDPTSDWARTGLSEILLLRSRSLVRWLTVVLGAAVFCLLFLLASNVQIPAGDGLIFGVLLTGFGILAVADADGPVYLAARRDPVATAVLSAPRRRAAGAAAVCLVVAVGSGVTALFTPPPAAFGVMFLALALVRPLTVACEAAPVWPQRLMNTYAVAFAGIGLLLTAYLAVADAPSQVLAATVLALGGMLASRRSSGVARALEKRFAKRPGALA